MDLSKYPIPHPQVAARTVDGSAVIVLADSGEVTVLNAVGTSVWELIDGARSLQDIAAAIQAEYEVSRAQAEQDVAQFVQSLAEAGAVVLSEQPSKREPPV
jgi:hypothetical protein